MDNAVLVPVVTELMDRLTGATLGDAIQIDSHRFALRFSVPPFIRVGIDLHPELCSLHTVQRVATPPEPTELSVKLTEALGGLPLAAVRKEPGERVVEMEFGDGWSPGRILVLELMGKSSNLLLLDSERTILRTLKTHKGTHRRPEPGAVYRPPEPRAGGPDLPMGSRLLAREVEWRAGAGDDPEAVRREVIGRMEEGGFEPVLYSPVPPEEAEESTPLPATACFVSPFPLRLAQGLIPTVHTSAAEAAGIHAALLHRHLLFRDLRSTLTSMVSAELRRLEKLKKTLETEGDRAAGSAETRRAGELILASLGTARKEGDTVEVTDFFHPETPLKRIPIDPALNLKANAEKIFRKARKQERAVTAIAARKEQTEGKLGGARGFLEELGAAGSSELLREIETRLNRSGLVKAVRRPARRELGRKGGTMRVKEYRTSDGWVVLVGRGASDNDLLTFKVAAPHDFWLHAAGRSGAHVIVRNPGRARALPERALEESAAMAAWFSRGDREVDVDVHVTRRKEVRKMKGMSPGTVMLRSYRTVRVRPAPPSVSASEQGSG